MPGAEQFSYRPEGAGWSEGWLAIGDQFVDATASYLTDALGDFLRAVLDIARGEATARATWAEEPGEYCWIFDRSGDLVRVRVLEFPDWRADVDAPDSDGETLLDAAWTVALAVVRKLTGRDTRPRSGLRRVAGSAPCVRC
jgi:hypothetical protein